MTNDELTFKEETDEINFFFEDIQFELESQELLIAWIKRSILKEKRKPGCLNFIFCSDKYLHKINVTFLDHDTYTDVITFSYSESKVEGDIFISIDRVRENAITFVLPFEQELSRVMIHGVLHLLGYNDKIPMEKEEMTKKENEYLSLLNGMKLDIK